MANLRSHVVGSIAGYLLLKGLVRSGVRSILNELSTAEFHWLREVGASNGQKFAQFRDVETAAKYSTSTGRAAKRR